MTKKRVRGLLDYMELKEGEIWEWEPPSEDYVYGMGLGATKEATRWAYKGYLQENVDALKTILSKKIGRPRKGPLGDIDCRRAFAAWYFVQINIPKKLRAGVTNRGLIGTMQSLQKAYEDNKVKHEKRLFPEGEATIESSISRGKTKLEINEIWGSKVCEKLQSDFNANDKLKLRG